MFRVLCAGALLLAGCKAVRTGHSATDRCAGEEPIDDSGDRKPQKDDFIRVTGWNGHNESIHAFNEIQGLSQEEMRKRQCTRACARAIDRDQPPSPFVQCSETCLESFLTAQELAAWKSTFPGPFQSRIKPISFISTEELRFFRDSVEFSFDTTWSTCGAADTARGRNGKPPDYLTQYDCSIKRRVVYRNWRIDNDTLFLMRGEGKRVASYPPPLGLRNRSDTAPEPDRALPFRLTQCAKHVLGQTKIAKSLELEGKTWLTPIYIGL